MAKFLLCKRRNGHRSTSGLKADTAVMLTDPDFVYTDAVTTDTRLITHEP